jgi:hypothetical protein
MQENQSQADAAGMNVRQSPVWEHVSRRTSQERAALIFDVADFVCMIASVRCQDPLRGNATQKSFLDFIVEDGDATFSQSHGGSISIYERRAVEQQRRVLDERIEALCRFCDRYRFLLSAMARSYCEGGLLNESIDLYPIVATDDLPSGGYFVRISLSDAVRGTASVSTTPPPIHQKSSEDKVTVGGFAIELARLLEAPIERWILECEARIEALVPFHEDDVDNLDACALDAHRKRTLRRRLVRLLSEHVAMVGFFVASEGPTILLERRGSRMTTELMEALISDYANEDVYASCEAMREKSISQLQLLLALCEHHHHHHPPESLAQLISEHQMAFLNVLRSPPSVLVRRPGYGSCDFRFHTLRSIVMSTTSATQSLTVVQLREWRHSIGGVAVGQLERFLTQSIDIIRKQVFPARGFVPTLRDLVPPPPTWSDPSHASDAYMFTRASLPLTSRHSEAHMQLPSTTEHSLRLISLVWEIMAYPNMQECYFTPGRVSVRYLREVVSIEQVNVAFAAMTLGAWKQKCGLGQTYRGAANAITNFRGSDIETRVRETFAKLCKWSLMDIMSVVSEEHSPLFHSTQWRLVDAVSQTMRSENPNGVAVQCSGVLGRVLDVVEPIVLTLRTDAGLRPVARPHPLADLLRIVPAIRNWDGRSDELILTTEDVAKSNSRRVRELLHSLSDQHSIVHYGRLGRGKKTKELGYGSKRVFLFNGPDLGAVLFGEYLG